MFIDGIKALLLNEKDIKLVGEALSGKEAIAGVTKERPDIILLDINMPDMDGIETTRELRKNFPDIKIIILTMHNNYEFISTLVSEGASGYILKNTGKVELIKAIKTVYSGSTFFSVAVTETIMKNLNRKPEEEKLGAVQLTKREKEILILIAQELSTKQIAEKLFISVNTVETHRKNLMAKLHAKNVTGLVKFAIQVGLIN